ncbi:MAG: S8 family serine peptidase, partial [Gemmataceae bacterium]
NNTNNPFDDEGHGTHVAGTIGAIGNNARGVVGVNWQVQLVALKFLDANGAGSTSSAVAALNYAVRNGIPISNNSWGGGGFSNALSNAIRNARDAGHIFVTAAGNIGRNNDTLATYPANYSFDNVVTVASTTNRDVLSSFSNFGASTVDLAAPGSSILSTLPNNRYGTLSGTSMAAPHVTGAMALVWSTDVTQTYSEVIARILNTVDYVSALKGRVVTNGRLNVARALEAVPPRDTTGPRVVSAEADSATRATRVRLTFSEPILARSFTLEDITGFVGPNGVSILPSSISVVPGSDNTQFDVNFAPLSAVGTYRFDVGPNITDLAGNFMDQSQDGIPGTTADSYRVTFAVSGFTRATFANTTSVAIRDFNTSASAIVISQDINISDVDVRVNISHTYASDLYIWLRGPDGTEVLLSAYRGGSGRNYSNTLFDDAGTTAIRNGTAPFSGSFRPEGSLANFNNTSARGTWRLFVYDGARFDTGTLTSWSLIVSGNSSGVLRRTNTESVTGQQQETLRLLTARDAVFASLPGETVKAVDRVTPPIPERSNPSVETPWGRLDLRKSTIGSFGLGHGRRRGVVTWSDSLSL